MTQRSILFSRRPYVLSLAILAMLTASPDIAHSADTAVVGFAIGEAAAATCPDNEYLAGVRVSYDNFISGLAPYCVPMAADGAWARGALLLTARQMSGPYDADHRPRPTLERFCPRDFYLYAYVGSTHVYGSHNLSALALTCRNGKTGALMALEKIQPQAGVSLTEWPPGQCAEGSVASGVTGRVDSTKVIEQFGFVCAITRPTATRAMLTDRPDDRHLNVGMAKARMPGAEVQVPANVPTITSNRWMVATPQTSVVATTPAAVGTCQNGYVWREAQPTDHVCVLPASRARTADENRAASGRRNPSGAYGPNTCIVGYVWREAFLNDVVCVTPNVRSIVAAENADGPHHSK